MAGILSFSKTQLSTGMIVLIIALALWDIAWKGVAMWKSGRNSQKGWFIANLVFNTVGILPIFYLALFSNKEKA